jgi:hypothetical protein
MPANDPLETCLPRKREGLSEDFGCLLAITSCFSREPEHAQRHTRVKGIVRWLEQLPTLLAQHDGLLVSRGQELAVRRKHDRTQEPGTVRFHASQSDASNQRPPR